MARYRPPTTTPYIVSSPLWSRAPSRDEHGKPYFDFMMLIPGLKQEDGVKLESYQVKIKNCLKNFEHVVVYVDLNIKLNLLWVSIKPVPEVSKHIMQAIQHEIPHARVVAGDFNPQTPTTRTARPLLAKLRKKMVQRFSLKGK